MTARLPTAITLGALLLAGCGSSPGPSTTSANTAGGPAAGAYRYATCMREHGVPNYPDPKVSNVTATSAQVAVMAPSQLVHTPGFAGAEKACSGILPGPGNQAGGHGGPGKAVLLAFARCLRSHGVSNFPDPDGQGHLTLPMISAAGVDIHAPSFYIAARACVGVTHGAITLAAVNQLVHGPH